MKRLAALAALAAAAWLGYRALTPRQLRALGLDRPFKADSSWAPDVLSGKWRQLPGCAGRPVFLYFWLADCPTAQENLRIIKELHERYKDTQLCFETVAVDDSEPHLRELVKEWSIDYPVYVGWGHTPDQLWPTETPWLYLVDRKGVVQKQLQPWAGNRDQIDAWIQGQLWDGSPEAAIPMGPPPPEVAAETAEVSDLVDYTHRLLSLSAFDDLDALADKLRSSKARFRWGQWQLDTFYRSIDEELADDAAYQQRLDLLRRWAAAKPASVTARVALGSVLTSFAWRARGSGWSKDVKPEDWTLFQDRLAEAHRVLGDAEALPAKCPQLYASQIRVGGGEQWDRAEVEAAFAKGAALEPGYTPLYRRMTWYLLPQWYGEPGEWERFAERSAAAAKLPDGMGLYARIAWDAEDWVVDRSKDGTLFTQTAVSWPKMRQGFGEIDKAAPGSWVLLNVFARFACLADDAPTARDLFTRLGDRYDPDVWGSSFEYGRWKLWAQGKSPRPDPKELSL